MISQRTAEAPVETTSHDQQRREVATLVVLSVGLLAGMFAQSILAAQLAPRYPALAVAALVALVCVSVWVLWRSVSNRRLWHGLPTHWWVVAAAAALPLAALATVVPDAPLRGRPEALASLNFVLVLAAATIAGRSLRRLPRVLVVGDRDFRDHVERVANRSRRHVVGWLEPPLLLTDATPKAVAAAGGVGYDEVVIQGECFERLSDIPPALRSVPSRLLVLIQPGASTRIKKGPAARAWTSFFDGPIPWWGRVQKRALDVTVSAVALVLAAPLLLAAIALIVLDTPGAPIFRQQRLGLNGRRFTLYKLRTMALNNSDTEHRQYVAALIRGESSQQERGLHKLTADRRITRIGRVLRHFSIDEIPQLWNVLRGEMSLVGPRPPLASEVELYQPTACQRLRVKPGLTGLWQVSGRSQLSFLDMVELDARYWQSWTPLLDLKILLRTPVVVVIGRGAA